MDVSPRYELVSETYPPEINGVALTVQSLHEGLRALGHPVGLVRPARDGERTGEDRSLLRVESAPIPRYPGLRFGMPAGARLAARWQRERPAAVYVATEGPLGWSAVRTARRLGIPVATGLHTRFDDYVGRYGAAFLSPWVFAWLRRFHNRGDMTLVPTRELAEQLRAQGFHKVSRLARAVDAERFHPRFHDEELRRSWGAPDQSPVVVHVGRLAPEKNLPLLLQSFDALRAHRPGAKLVLVGDGPERAALAAHFASADLFGFPSLSETFGNVTLEAMASGIATVAFNYGAAREHLQDGAHGASIPFGNEEAFVERFVATALSPKLSEQGAAARRAVEGLSPAQVARDFAALLAGLSRPLASVA